LRKKCQKSAGGRGVGSHCISFVLAVCCRDSASVAGERRWRSLRYEHAGYATARLSRRQSTAHHRYAHQSRSFIHNASQQLLYCPPQGAALSVEPRPSVRPFHASDFLEIGKTIETSNLVETWRWTIITSGANLRSKSQDHWERTCKYRFFSRISSSRWIYEYVFMSKQDENDRRPTVHISTGVTVVSAVFTGCEVNRVNCRNKLPLYAALEHRANHEVSHARPVTYLQYAGERGDLSSCSWRSVNVGTRSLAWCVLWSLSTAVDMYWVAELTIRVRHWFDTTFRRQHVVGLCESWNQELLADAGVRWVQK